MDLQKGLRLISSDEAMRYLGMDETYSIITGPSGIAVYNYADEPDYYVGYLSDEAVREWVRRGWLDVMDEPDDEFVWTTWLAWAESQRRRTGILPPLCPM